MIIYRNQLKREQAKKSKKNNHKKRKKQRERKIFTSAERREIIEIYGNICYICQTEIDVNGLWHIDHIHPFIKGGTDSIANLRPTHPDCNVWKGTRIIDPEKLRKARNGELVLLPEARITKKSEKRRIQRLVKDSLVVKTSQQEKGYNKTLAQVRNCRGHDHT